MHNALIVTLLAAALAGAGIARAAAPDCRACHGQAAGARDVTEYYAQPLAHHRIGIPYPTGFDVTARFNRPTSRQGDVAFFDLNGNGVLDPVDIPLYGEASSVECASCHREHGADGPGQATPPPHLRLRNDDSALCLVCHRS